MMIIILFIALFGYGISDRYLHVLVPGGCSLNGAY